MEQKAIQIPKSAIYVSGILLVIIVAGFFMLNQSGSGLEFQNEQVSGNVVAGTGEIQEVVIGMKNYNYYPDTINLKAGIPARVSLDDSVYGCFRDLTIRDFGIREYLKTSEDYVEFTPMEPGTYPFACSMGMGFGKLVVT